MSRIYPSYCYNHNFVLRVTPLLWLIIIWSVNHLLVLGLAVFAKSGETLGLAIEYASNPFSLLSDLPGAMVMVAVINRRPAAGKIMRWLWHYGRLFLIAGVCAQVAIIIGMYWQKTFQIVDEWLLIILAANIVFFVFLLRSRLIKDIFLDFPQPIAESKK